MQYNQLLIFKLLIFATYNLELNKLLISVTKLALVILPTSHKKLNFQIFFKNKWKQIKHPSRTAMKVSKHNSYCSINIKTYECDASRGDDRSIVNAINM